MSSSTLYFFIFGRNPKLSLAELSSYFISHSITSTKYCSNHNFLILEITGKFNPHKTANDLAGTVKIGKIYIHTDQPTHLYDLLLKNNFYLEDYKSLNYAISIYGMKLKNEQFFFDEFKKIYKKINQKASLKKPTPSGLCNSLARKNFVDIAICVKNSHYYIGRTLAAYNIKQNKIRYEQRPYIDETIGSSVRFSRILVNLSQKRGGTLLDPFCGIGTVLQEALLSGFDVIGSELEKERIKFCEANLKWVSQQYQLHSPKMQLINSDIRELHTKLQKDSIDTVVTEPELGPLLKSTPTFNSTKSIISSLEDLYLDSFFNIDFLLKTGGTLVIVLPQIQTTNGKKLKPDIQKLVADTNLVPITTINSGYDPIFLPIYYKESYHILGRLVYLFRKQNRSI
jgi:tRNA G10  N-methylase Trm11